MFLAFRGQAALNVCRLSQLISGQGVPGVSGPPPSSARQSHHGPLWPLWPLIRGEADQPLINS